MPRKKKVNGAEPKKMTKVDFVRSLPSDLSAAEVVDRAKKEGITLTTKHVHVMRSNDRARAKRGGSNGAGRAKSGGGQNKSAFVMSMPLDMPLSQVTAKAKEAGLDISPKHVSAIRSMAKKRGKIPAQAHKAAAAPAPVKRRLGRPPGSGAKAKAAVAASKFSAEDVLKAAAHRIGVRRAIELLQDEDRMLVSLLGA